MHPIATFFLRPYRTRSAFALAVLALLPVAGCKKDEPTTEKIEPIPRQELAFADDGPKRKTILGAIAPAGGRENWIFFKLTGPTSEVEKERANFNEFIDSLRYDPDPENEKRPFRWTTPAGWTWKAGSQFRLATFKMGPLDVDTFEDPVTALLGVAAFHGWQSSYDAKYPELSVSRARGTVIANVNRWRDQVGLGPVENVDLPRLLRYKDVKDATLIMVEMSGPGPKPGAPKMVPPFHPPVQ